jgi:hypothetical protein
MDAIYKLFALSFIAEREAYRNIESWETIAAASGRPAPEYATDSVYASLINEWNDAHVALKDVERDMLKAYRKERAAGTFTVMSAK